MSDTTFTPFAAVKTHSMDTSADAIEKASATQQQWREFVPGRKDWSMTLNYLVLENADSNIEDLLKVGMSGRNRPHEGRS